MDEFGFSVTVAVGCVLGLALAAPNTEALTAVVFVVANALFALVAFAVAGALFSLGRNRRGQE